MSAIFRVLDLPPEGPARVFTGLEEVGPPRAGVLRWVDLSDQTETETALLGERFGFHPLTLEDCLHFDQRPKVEEYGEYLFIVLHAFAHPKIDVCEIAPQ